MDLSAYTKKSQSSRRASGEHPVEKRCLECGRKLERQSSNLYYPSFCSPDCKERYVNSEGTSFATPRGH